MAKTQKPADGERNGVQEVEVQLTPLEMLAALARMDLEAALAYDAAAELAGDRDLAAQLGSFARDHRRHVDDLNHVLEAQGAAAVSAGDRPPLLAGLVQLAGPLGADVLVTALLCNEQLTNLSYDGALAYEWEGELEAVLRRGQKDEERHLFWLSERHDDLGMHSPEGHQPLVE
jgi:rubrerythrin